MTSPNTPRSEPAFVGPNPADYVPGSSEPHRWVDFADYRRHAVPAQLRYSLGEELTVFCGARVTACRRDPLAPSRWKTCEPCQTVALELLNGLAAPEGTP